MSAMSSRRIASFPIGRRAELVIQLCDDRGVTVVDLCEHARDRSGSLSPTFRRIELRPADVALLRSALEIGRAHV